METKPYNLQSPEQIAKDYGGNKQKIAEAMQMGILDATAGTMAGMFIDRMRSAAQQEAAPQQTIAQQVMAPQPQMPQGMPQMPMGAPQGAPAGLGATPEAAAMPQMPMGAPAPAGLGATPEAAAMPPMGAPPQGEMPMMAEGGMVPPYASGGGLSDMPLPDGMFDEPSNGGFGDGYAGGGIIAFQSAGEVNDPKKPKTQAELDEEAYLKKLDSETFTPGDITVTGDNTPESLYGNYRDPLQQKKYIESMYKPKREASDSLMDLLKGEGSPEELKRRKKEDMWMALGQIGAKMATTPGSLLQAASAGISEALPGIAAAAKQRKADQREAIKTMAQQEGLSNKESLDMFKLVQEGTNKFGEFDVSRLSRAQQERFELLRDKTDRYKADLAYRASIFGSQKHFEGVMGSANIAERRMIGAITNQAAQRVMAMLPNDALYNQFMAKKDKVGANKRYNELVQDEIRKTFSGDYGASADNPLGLPLP